MGKEYSAEVKAEAGISVDVGGDAVIYISVAGVTVQLTVEQAYELALILNRAIWFAGEEAE